MGKGQFQDEFSAEEWIKDLGEDVLLNLVSRRE